METTYRQGKPCKNCGTVIKYTSSGSCVNCVKTRTNNKRLQDVSAANQKGRKRYKEHRQERIRNSQNWRNTHPEHRSNYYKNHKDTELKQNKLWRKEHHQQVIYLATKRKRRIRTATPKWTDLKAIQLIYLNCPEGMQVDHIVPLQNSIVCGLHVPWNLQYLTPTQNRKKSNKHNVKI